MMKQFLKKLAGKEKKGQDLPNLCFVHLPKCGGQSLVSSLKSLYKDCSFQSTDMGAAIEAFESTYGPFEGISRSRELEWNRYRQSLLMLYLGTGIKLVYGHHPCGKEVLDRFSGSYRFITVLRDPVSRFISNYVYDRVGPRREAFQSDLDPKEELEAFLHSEQAVWLANLQVSMLGGYLSSSRRLEANFNLAKENLQRYAVVGFTEDMEQFSDAMKRELHLELSIPKINTGGRWQMDQFDYKSLFDQEIKKRIEGIARPEMDLYHWAHGQFA